ncbi:MAG TPA: polyhydroxyalkanoate synthesis repressor PhaR [Rhodospirillales bacterium]|nr:polyhydroxyalkanoate synthesis repressor PhaR [Rhodospirillales bacterium]
MKDRTAPDPPSRDRERGEPKVAVVKKYANRRLYNTETSSYVTLEELSRMTREGREFVVYDAKTGEDITRSVLTQIILEEDSKGRNLLPIGFLRHLISFYDDSLKTLLPRYLELSMENFARHQDQMRSYMEQTFGRFFPVKQFEELTRQNLALFQQAANMFNPFAGEQKPASGDERREAEERAGEAADAQALGDEVRELRRQMEALQRQIDALTRGRNGGDRSGRRKS